MQAGSPARMELSVGDKSTAGRGDVRVRRQSRSGFLPPELFPFFPDPILLGGGFFSIPNIGGLLDIPILNLSNPLTILFSFCI